MSDAPDKESKTEHATEKRTADAVEKGNLPFSREIVNFGSILALLAVVGLMAADAIRQMTGFLMSIFAAAGDIDLRNGADAAKTLTGDFSQAGTIILPPLLLLALGGMLAALTQNVPTATWERLKPNASRLSPASNGKRMFGKEGLLEFVKIIVKTVLVLVVAGLSLKLAMAAMLAGGLVPASALPATMRDQILRTVSQLAILALVMAVLDGLWVRLKWRKDLMMTRQEVKDEHKQQEGDPMLKQRRLALARQRSNSRMMSDLPKATVVIANPTHYAVAIRYVPSEGGAPKVLAKGADHLALRIRETCEGLQIPVVENKPLARALHDSVTVGEMIPAEFYRAVAEIIHFVEMRKKVQGSSAFR